MIFCEGLTNLLAREKVVDDGMIVVVVAVEKARVLFICFDMMIMNEVIPCLRSISFDNRDRFVRCEIMFIAWLGAFSFWRAAVNW